MLYTQLALHKDKSKTVPAIPSPNRKAANVWKENGDCIVPWAKDEDVSAAAIAKTYPLNCYTSTTTDITDTDNSTTDSTSVRARFLKRKLSKQ
jgi:hypothetical protein